MTQQAYGELCQAMAQRGGAYPGMDIPEFYPLVEELFTPEEARLCASMPRRPSSASQIAQETGLDPQNAARLLETMADKGLLSTLSDPHGQRLYAAIPFVPGIFEFQSMRVTETERDSLLARLIRDYKKALDANRGGAQPVKSSLNGVIPAQRTVRALTRLHTYEQVSSYIERYDPISVATCFCRHEARLLEGHHRGKPNDICMQFGGGGGQVRHRGDGPSVAFPGRFRPTQVRGLRHRIERCPAGGLELSGDIPRPSLERCSGCGACASGCPSEATELTHRPGAQPSPRDRNALKEVLASAR